MMFRSFAAAAMLIVFAGVTTALPTAAHANSCWFDVAGRLPPAPTKPLNLATELSRLPKDRTAATSPFVHREKFNDEAQQYGYRPQIPSSLMTFTHQGVPLLRGRDSFELWWLDETGEWRSKSVRKDVEAAMIAANLVKGGAGLDGMKPLGFDNQDFHHMSGRIALDDACGVYMLMHGGREARIGKVVLLFSPDGSQTWQAYELPMTAPAVQSATMELANGGRVLSGPPVILTHALYHDCSKGVEKCETPLNLVLPRRVGSRLEIGDPVQVSRETISAVVHSGGGNMAVSDGDLVHVAFAGSRVPSSVKLPRSTFRPEAPQGTAFYVATYDRAQRRWTQPPTYVDTTTTSIGALLDDHNQPLIAVDKSRHVHVLLGAHHSNLKYFKSKVPGSMASGWAIRETVGNPAIKGRYRNFYTYPSLTIDVQGTANVVARWVDDDYAFNLVHLRRTSAGWQRFEDALTQEENQHHQRLVIPEHKQYNVWYHRVVMDPWGKLWLGYSYNPNAMTDAKFADYRARYKVEDRKPISCRGEGESEICDYSLPSQSFGWMVREASGGPWRLATTMDFFPACKGKTRCLASGKEQPAKPLVEPQKPGRTDPRLDAKPDPKLEPAKPTDVTAKPQPEVKKVNKWKRKFKNIKRRLDIN